VFTSWWRHSLVYTDVWGYQSLPSQYRYLAAPNFVQSLAKLAEIFFQNVLTIAAISMLLLQGDNLWLITLFFVLAVFLVHLPALMLYGTVFAGFFLLLILVVTPFFPLIIANSPYALYLLFAIHVSMYPLRLILLKTKTELARRNPC
jgi:hypothetical protein